MVLTIDLVDVSRCSSHMIAYPLWFLDDVATRSTDQNCREERQIVLSPILAGQAHSHTALRFPS